MSIKEAMIVNMGRLVAVIEEFEPKIRFIKGNQLVLR